MQNADGVSYDEQYINTEQQIGQTDTKPDNIDTERTKTNISEPHNSKLGYLKITLISNVTNKEYQKRLVQEKSKLTVPKESNNQASDENDNEEYWESVTIEDPYYESIPEASLEEYYDSLKSYKIPDWEEDFDIEKTYEPKNAEDYVPKEYDEDEMTELKALPIYAQHLEYNINGMSLNVYFK